MEALAAEPDVGAFLEDELLAVGSSTATTAHCCIEALLSQASEGSLGVSQHAAPQWTASFFRASRAYCHHWRRAQACLHTRDHSFPSCLCFAALRLQLMSSGIHFMAGAPDDLAAALWRAAKALLMAAPTAGMRALLALSSPQGAGPLVSNLLRPQEAAGELRADSRAMQ